MSVDTLFNTSWQVLIGVAVLWWTMFTALRLSQRNSASDAIRQRLESLARPRARTSSPASMVERWRENLENVGLTFEVTPNRETMLIALKWFLGGLLATGLILAVTQIIMFSSDVPLAGETHAIRLISIASLVSSGIIALAILVTGLICEGFRAVKDLASPRGKL